MNKTILSFALLLITSYLVAQKTSGIPLAKQVTLHSEIVGDDYSLQVTLPYPFKPYEKKYPVLFYLDAFGKSAGMNELVKSKMYSRSFQQFVMVGISYNTNLRAYGKLRSRDYIPPMNDMDSINGGSNFLNFIKDELIPYCETNYSTDPNDRGLLGHSLGGLFTAWAFKKEPDLFNKLAILSPSLQYGKSDLILENDKFLNNIKNAQNLSVFISYGSQEGYEFIALGNQLHDKFKTNSNISVTKVVFEDESHGSVWNTAATRALYVLYEDPFHGLIKKMDILYYEKNYIESLKTYEIAFKKYPEQTDEGDRYVIACLYALTGDPDNAFKYINTLNAENQKWHDKVFRDPDLKSLHEDARWNSLIITLKNK
jgi:predicted alpha/beta superfamily hydrolase